MRYYAHIYVIMRIHAHMRNYACVNMRICALVCAYMRWYAHICVSMRIYAQMRNYACVDMRIYALVCAYMRIYAHKVCANMRA